jgi:hypothetical protein
MSTTIRRATLIDTNRRRPTVARRRKLFHVRMPWLRMTSRGLRLSGGGIRIGGKTAINISKRGISASTRTPIGTFNTRRGLTVPVPRLGRRRGGCVPGCLLAATGLLGLGIVGTSWVGKARMIE